MAKYVYHQTEAGDAKAEDNMLPQMPQYLFGVNPAALCLLHFNIGNLKTKLPDVAADNTFRGADVISLNETHLSANDILT